MFYKFLLDGFFSMSYKNFIMIFAGIILLFLGIKKKYEPLLLVPIAFSVILVNLPHAIVLGSPESQGIIQIFYEKGIITEILPLLIFIGAGCMIDFRPLFERPYFLLFGLIAHSGIFVAALIGFLMLGNLIKECGVLEKLSKTAQNELSTIATLLLSLGIGATMSGENFLTIKTLLILLLGLTAFIFDIIAGLLFAKLINLFLKKENKINPMLGACGLSAFPMASRTVQALALEEDDQNFILMHAVSANVSGQIGSLLIAGIIMQFLSIC